ncbi:hypothetical protein SSX86_017135 [Deinandra increscens subsp. villosa]|uniref:Uncharacterized protein n=1 Tax=Deinandra increscens subsp. villosa TaxID=3103831 RepID=A0AAP0CUH7_9ASTR
MDPYSLNAIFKDLKPCNLSIEVQIFLENLVFQSELQNQFSKPMMWIGIYISVASLFCILPMVADLLHGLKTKKLWFPCNYFTLNAASLTVIAVAMKLPMDLSNPMQLDVDRAAKLGSMAFMCTIMANLLPSLATMGSKELLINIIALGVLVITLIVNVCIQIETGVVSPDGDILYTFLRYKSLLIAIIYVAMLLVLLMIYACSALMILKSKQILESKYQAAHETTLNDLDLQQPGRITVEKLKQHVSNHWIMAGTGSPQFMTVCSVTASASGVICLASTLLHVVLMLIVITNTMAYGSDYKWSVLVIFITQFTGAIVATVAPISRCFAILSFKASMKLIWNHIRIFKVESYYTQKIYDWKQSRIPFRLGSRRYKIVIHYLKVLSLSSLIGFQKMVVVGCKMIALIPICFVTGIFCCFRCWKLIKVMFGASYSAPERNPQHKDLSRYVLQLQDDMEFAERTLKSISKSVNHLIKTAEKQQPNNLMKLLEEFNDFEGVGKYDMHQVQRLPEEEKYADCWSLPIVTLATIAISLPKMQNNNIDRLLRSVSEGLTYVTFVEETLNATDEYVTIQKVARTLWLEVEVYHEWLGNKLQNPAHQDITTKEIVQWFSDTAENMVTEVECKNMKGSDDSSLYKSVSADSMYRITQTILVTNHVNIDQVSKEELFVQLSSMISNILAACLTNLPQVIAMKCHTSVIEKREESVHTAAQLLGETMQIINSFQDRQLPSLDHDELPFIDKWRDWFLHISP